MFNWIYRNFIINAISKRFNNLPPVSSNSNVSYIKLLDNKYDTDWTLNKEALKDAKVK